MRILWHRVLTAPTTRVESVAGDVTLLRIDGLVCDDVCAVRSRQALERLDGVSRVTVDHDAGLARIEGRPLDAAVYERAVTAVVTGMGSRRWLERLVRPFRRLEASRGGKP